MNNWIRSNSQKVEKLLSRMELVALVLCAAGIFAISNRSQYSSVLIITGLSLLSFVYAFLARYIVELFKIEHVNKQIQVARLSYLALSISAMGILFDFSSWPGGAVMLQFGTALLILGFVVVMYLTVAEKIKEEQEKTIINNLIYRMLPILLITGFMLLSLFK